MKGYLAGKPSLKVMELRTAHTHVTDEYIYFLLISVVVKNSQKSISYFLNGDVHRIDGPCIYELPHGFAWSFFFSFAFPFSISLNSMTGCQFSNHYKGLDIYALIEGFK